jgi:hypothetical protein
LRERALATCVFHGALIAGSGLRFILCEALIGLLIAARGGYDKYEKADEACRHGDLLPCRQLPPREIPYRMTLAIASAT